MAAAPHVVTMLGEATAAQLGSAVAAGPFARQPPAAASAAGPLTWGVERAAVHPVYTLRSARLSARVGTPLRSASPPAPF